MKNINKLFLGLGLSATLFGLTTACSDFDDLNTSPSQVGVEFVKPHYALNKSIIGAQQNPEIAERIVIYNWASAARICGELSYLNIGRYSDDFNSLYFNNYLTGWIKNATLAIETADGKGNLTDHERVFYANVKQFARIWRAYLISEFADNYGPYPIEAFSGKNPTFNTVKETYYFILKELKEAAPLIDTSVVPNEDEKRCDPAYGYNAMKWKKYANSLRMRLAMRLSEVDAPKAKSEFEEACAAEKILTLDDMFSVKEYSGWDDFSGIFTRPWNDQALSSTMSNILTNLGGVGVVDQRPDLATYTKPNNYIGMKFQDHYAVNTDNPTKMFWLDGIPENLDPRALKIFCLPNDEKAANFIDKGSKTDHAKHGMEDKDGKVLVPIDAQFTWNYYPAGSRAAWSPKFALNKVTSNIWNTGVLLGKDYCSSENKRIWFGPWETYFLMAEAAVRGWNTGSTAQAAYENGIRVNFEYFDVSKFVDSYINSTDYNRVGTSVKFTHTTEPTDMAANYVDGYTKAAGTMTYKYPDANKILYRGKKLNDALTKIITQKYIAQTPYLALECWSDFRRLGLPFFDMPANESTMTGSDMVSYWTVNSYTEGQSWKYYPQRLRYPSGLKNADSEGYAQAIKALGGDDTTMTPLWWAKH